MQSAKLSSTKCREPMICEKSPPPPRIPPHEINPLYGMRVYYCMDGSKIHVLHNLSSNLHILSDIPQETCQYSSSGLNIYLYSIIMHTHAHAHMHTHTHNTHAQCKTDETTGQNDYAVTQHGQPQAVPNIRDPNYGHLYQVKVKLVSC